ncbi:MAG: hypothetical protein Q9182_007564 [Xanthomendoza sp. 2 TL-2023]
MLDGYDELPEDWQEKIKRAITDGHVDDEDWKGDLEQNRPGKRGFRSPAPKKKKKAADEEHSGVQEGCESPSKARPKKRGRPKKEHLEDDETEEPARKKPKAAAKKVAKVKDEEDDFDESSKTIANKREQPKAQAVDIDGTAKPKRKGAAKRTKAPKEEAIVDGPDTLATVPETNDVATRGKKTTHGDGSKNSETGAQPAKAAKGPGKAPTKNAGQQGLAGEHEEQTAKMTKSSRVTKSAANTKKPIAKKRQQDMEAIEETVVAAAPKAKRGRKKAAS